MWSVGTLNQKIFFFNDTKQGIPHQLFPGSTFMMSLLEAGGSASHHSSELVRCCVLLQGAVGWNSMLFVWATLADLDRLGPERLFCLTQSMISLCVK